MIKLTNATKRFGDKTAVDHFSMKLEPGTITGFIGPNGAGKTTTLRMLTGVLEPDEGSVEINGYDMKENPIEAKKQFGFISDNPDLFTPLKGVEYVNFICDIYQVPEEVRAQRLDGLLDEFEMRDAIGDKLGTYSHGMRQKVHIIATLMHDPDLWIMDEPMTGLDPQSSYILKRKMRQHAEKGNTVLFSTHVLEVAEKLCDHIVIIAKGREAYNGTLEALKAQYPDTSLEEIFLEVTGSRVHEQEGMGAFASGRDAAAVEAMEVDSVWSDAADEADSNAFGASDVSEGE